MSAPSFVDTSFCTAADKAKLFRKLKKFVRDGFPKQEFTKPFWRRLHMMFHHIAHYDADGFYEHWFASPEKQLAWVNHVLKQTFTGDPTCSWRDVEEAFQKWLKNSPIPRQLEELVGKRAQPFSCNTSDKVVGIIVRELQEVTAKSPPLSLEQIVKGVLSRIEHRMERKQRSERQRK